MTLLPLCFNMKYFIDYIDIFLLFTISRNYLHDHYRDNDSQATFSVIDSYYFIESVPALQPLCGLQLTRVCVSRLQPLSYIALIKH